MRLITHNLLKCNVKGVESGYPLVIEPVRVEIVESEFDAGAVCVLYDRMAPMY